MEPKTTYREEQLKVIKERIIYLFEEKKASAEHQNQKVPTIYSLYTELNKYDDLGISYSTFRNTLTPSQKGTLDMYTVLSLLQYWNVDASFVFAPPQVHETIMPPIQDLLPLGPGKFIVLNDRHYHETYYGFMYSQNTRKEKDSLRFELEIGEEGGYPFAQLTYFGNLNEKRIFRGTPVLATKSNTVFILFTERDGNYYVFSFNYRQYNVRKMYYRKGMILSASSVSGDPLVQSFVLFSKKISKTNEKYLPGLLAVSDSIFYVSQKAIEQLKEEDENVRLLFDSLGYLILPDQEIVYQISEEQILRTLEKQSSKHLNRHDMIRAMIKLKEYSLAPDKISYEEQKEYTEFVKTVMQGIGDNCLPEEIE